MQGRSTNGNNADGGGMTNIYHLPSPEERCRDLTPEQEAYWWEQYEISSRAVQYAKKQLGILAVEKGLERIESDE